MSSQTLPENSLESLIQALRREGGALCQNSDDAGPLRRLQDLLRDLLPSLPGPYPRFLGFLLADVIEDLFYNVVGDIPAADPVHELQRNLFSNAGIALSKVASTLEENKFEECNELCVDFVNFYLEQVGRLDGILSRKR